MALQYVAMHCRCGASWDGWVAPRTAESVRATIQALHQGAGHGACDAITARRARYEADRQAAIAAYDAAATARRAEATVTASDYTLLFPDG